MAGLTAGVEQHRSVIGTTNTAGNAAGSAAGAATGTAAETPGQATAEGMARTQTQAMGGGMLQQEGASGVGMATGIAAGPTAAGVRVEAAAEAGAAAGALLENTDGATDSTQGLLEARPLSVREP